MESVIPNMEKAEENYKVPNLEKGIAVLEYLSLHTQGETLQDISPPLIFHRLRPTVFKYVGSSGLFDL
mgnify:CR=1 FL=1